MAIQQEITNIAMHDGITHAVFVSPIITVIALILSFFLKRTRPPQEENSPLVEEVESTIKETGKI